MSWMKNFVTLFTAIACVSTSYAFEATHVPQTGQVKCYDYSYGQVIDCAGTGQDGELRYGVSWPDPRFTDNGNGTITDNLTGLIWLKNANCIVREWLDLLNFANNLASGQCGLTDGSVAGDWRIPNVLELSSLINRGELDSATWLGIQGFTGVPNFYWTSSVLFCQEPFYVDLERGEINHYLWDGCASPMHYGSEPLLAVRDGGNGAVQLPKTGVTKSVAKGDDGDLQRGSDWPVPRFVENGDQTITDRLTSLVWTKDSNTPGPAECSPASAKNWSGAFDHVTCLNKNRYLGYDDWRLPNVNEVNSLVNYGQLFDSGPATLSSWLTSNGFTGFKHFYIWTSTSRQEGLGAMAVIVALDGGVGYATYGGGRAATWPVRTSWSIDGLTVDGGLFSFGRAAALGTVVTIPVKLRNVGNSPKTVNSMAVVGNDQAEFSLVTGGDAPCASRTPMLNPGDLCSVDLIFTSAKRGSKAAAFSIGSSGQSLSIPISASAYTTIYGTVTDDNTKLPVSGAKVSLSTGATTKTLDNGTFDLGALGDGDYTMTVVKTGYQVVCINNLVVSATSSKRADVSLVPAVAPTSVNLTSSPLIPKVSIGAPVTFTAAATGGTGPYEYRFFYKTPAGAVVQAQAYSTAATWNWATKGLPAGSYQIFVNARNIGSEQGLEAGKMLNFALVVPVPPSTVSLTPSLPAPGNIGAQITFTAAASGGSGPYEYKFLYKTPAGAWVTARDYSTTATWSWATTGLAAGIYQVVVHARNLGSLTNYEVFNSLNYTLIVPIAPTSVSLTPTPVSPSLVGVQVNFTATASGGTGPYEYRFFYKTPAGTWVTGREYAPTSTWTWATRGLPGGTYQIVVHARNVGSPQKYEVVSSIIYVITIPVAPSAVLLTRSFTSPTSIGAPITFTAAATGGSGPYEYRFFYKTPAGTWTTARDYATTATWTWTTAGLAPGTYQVVVHARNVGSAQNYEVVNSLNHTLVVPVAPLSVSVTPDVPSPSPVGTSITFSAAASGGTGPYEYKFFYKTPAGTWFTARDYSTTATWNWKTAGLVAGTYQVVAHCRNVGSPQPMETYGVVNYNLE